MPKVKEEYLETIYELICEKKQARVSEVAERLDISPASVTEMIQKLQKKGYVVQERYGPIKLTKKGTLLAKTLNERHNILKTFLQLLGIDEDIAETDACEIEHSVNQETIRRLTSFVKFIRQTPEGKKWLNHFKSFHEKKKSSEKKFDRKNTNEYCLFLM